VRYSSRLIDLALMERALITGGTGFVGKHLVSYLQSVGSRVAVLSSGEAGEERAEMAFYPADIRDRDKVRSVIQEFKPDHIYHLAAISAVGDSWQLPRLTYEVNVFGTLNVFEAAINLPSPPKILNISTAQVYARSSAPLSETSSVSPENPYAASKLMAEFLNVQCCRHAECGIVTARSFNHTGPGQSADFVLSSIAKQFVEMELGQRERKLSVGNTHVRRDFTDVRDVVAAYVLLMRKGRPSEIYNVCSGRAISIKAVIEEFECISGIKVEIDTHPGKRRIGDAEEVCGNPAKIQAATGWKPVIPLKTTLLDLLGYWRLALHQSSPQKAPSPVLHTTR
jgi:GDP-4-dehydro-6-deoxy-D-mannose reductase